MANTFLSGCPVRCPFRTPDAEADMSFASPGARRLTGRGGLSGRFRGRGKRYVGPRREEGMRSYRTERAVPCRRDGPPVDVITWRRCRLLEAGFPGDLAEMLA